MNSKITPHVSEQKKKVVKELSELMKKRKTLLVVSIKNIPASQFQEMTKKLRGKAEVRVPRRNLITRAVEMSGETNIKELESKIKDNVAILFSDADCFELAAELVQNKSPAKANPGQEAPEDIEIPAGPTELTPGPAISELGAVGIQIQIDKGKISIKESRIVVRKGEKISSQVADVLSKLDIKPFSISLVPLAGYDFKEKKAYLSIEIDIEKTLKDLKWASGKALPFALGINYICDETVNLLLQKAWRHEVALNQFVENNQKDKSESNSEVN